MTNNPPSLSHRSFVNTWNCDENAHMNVRFYYGFFEEAAQFFAHQIDQKNEYRPAPIRQVRYLRELPVAATIAIYSQKITQGAFANCTFHFLYNETTGDLSATAIDMPNAISNVNDDDWQALGEPYLQAKPRSLSLGDFSLLDNDSIEQMQSEGRIKMSHRALVNHDICDATGMMRCQDHIGCFSNAAAFAWQFTGLSAQTMIEENIGRVAVEMKLNRLAPVRLGTMLEMVSFVVAVQAKSFTLCHIGRDFKTKAPLFTGQATALLMDLETRRVLPFNDEILTKLNAAKIEF